MKNIFKIIVLVCISLGLLNAESIEQNGQKDGYEIKVSSEKTLIVGNNDIFIELSKDTKQINDAKVKFKVFMPEMPVMPYMEFEEKATLIDGKYKVSINFSMNGTWQYQLKFKTNDDVVHTVKGSVNL